MINGAPSCCPQSSSEIKKWVKEKLNLTSNETVLVSVCGKCEETVQTLVMVIDDEGRKEKFRFYKIGKIPQKVAEGDIPADMDGKCCMELVSIQYDEGKLMFS